MITKQQIFTKVKAHLLQQGKQSMRQTKFVQICAYRGNEGLKCAIGCLIPDNEYSSCIEGYAIHALINNPIQLASATLLKIVDAVGLQFLENLQHIHDNMFPELWEIKLDELADIYYLEIR